MFPFPKLRRQNRRGVALLVVLAMIVIVSLMLVAFVTAMRLERTASSSYSQSILAEEFARSAANLVTADLQNEMAASAPPDSTYPLRPLFTNVSAINVLPQRIGTNAAMPLLVRTSTNGTFTNATGAPSTSSLIASTVKTATPSRNGRYVDAARWSTPMLGTFPAANVPSWVYITRGGVTNGQTATFTGAGTAVNNLAAGNQSYAIGRFAYAVYDVGGLVDVTLAGYPPTLTSDQIAAIKGRLAGADLSALGIDPAALTAWRNKASASSGSAYVGWATNSTNAVLPGDTTFFSRQDLIKAAKAGVAGLTTNSVPNLTVFSRERNASSWKPATANGTNSFIPSIRRTATGTLTDYRNDSSTLTDPFVAGDPVAMRRFPLARLAWIGPAGPQNGGTPEAIQACFGLRWNAATGIWDYIGATGTTKQKTIKTLTQVAAESPAREPNFFELLQAAIPTGSLAKEGQLDAGGAAILFSTIHEKSLTLHILRIGASILSQYDSSACPIVIAYDQSGADWQAAGIDNLPYLNMLTLMAGANSTTNVGCYLTVSLWNPHQGAITTHRPKVRLRLKGSVMLGNGYGNYLENGSPTFSPSVRKGYTKTIDATVELSDSAGNGVNGFIDPHVLRPADFATPVGVGSEAGLEWAATPQVGGVAYAGYRLPDFIIDPTRKPKNKSALSAEEIADGSTWNMLWFWATPTLTQPFNAWLEYQNPNGTWVPYNYFAGINDPATWMTKAGGFYSAYFGAGWKTTPAPNDDGLVATLQAWNPDATASFFNFRRYFWELADPRSLRFGPTQHQTTVTAASISSLYSSLWSSVTEPSFQTYGRVAYQEAQKIFGLPFTPAGLSRNNNAGFVAGAGANTLASYTDPDGTRRVADSGLFTDLPTSGNSWKGDPYALSTTRVKDRPVILNRPFNSVAEIGYASRDYPWRTLDLFSTNSADGALLDVFTIGSGTDNSRSGSLNLNSVRTETLNALLTNTRQDALTSTLISNPAAISANVFQQISTNAMSAKGEIVSRLVGNLPTSVFGNEDEEKVKPRREATTRAFADVGQVRTWNLLIDVVAQAGRFPPAATSLSDFNVEAEKRIWVHVAIDRFTGEVVDQTIEPVTP